MRTGTVILGGLCVIGIALGAHNYYTKSNPPEGLWSLQKSSLKNERFPASLPLQIDPELYQSYFIPETFGHYISYDMDFRFSTDLDKPYLQKKTKKALETAISQTFMEINKGNDPSTGMMTLLKKNLVSEFMDKFVKTLRVYKIFDGNFQIDLIFTPKKKRNLDFQTELSSNQLIHFDNKGSLVNKINNNDNSIPKVIESAGVPVSGELYQYVGGVISLNLELVDLSPRFRVPKPKENIVKGNLLLRRYIRLNRRSALSLTLKDNNLQNDMLHITKYKDSEDKILTVDINKKFNLKNPIPSLDNMTVHFGKIVDKETKTRNLWNRFTNFFTSEDIRTSNFNLYGKYQNNEYKAKLRKLVYSFEDNSFTTKSQLDIEFKYPGNNENLMRQKTFMAKKSILKDYRSELSIN